MTKKTVLIEISARTEIFLCVYAVAWAIWIIFFDFEDSIATRRYVLGFWVGGWGLLLMLCQWKALRVQLDYYTAMLLLRLTRNDWAPWIVKIWPLSTIARIWLHFWFTVWWLLMAWAVLLRLDDISSIRTLSYVLVALLHFDKFLRLFQAQRA